MMISPEVTLLLIVVAPMFFALLAIIGFLFHMLNRMDKIDGKIDGMTKGFAVVGERLARLELGIAGLDNRLAAMVDRVAAMVDRVAAIGDRVAAIGERVAVIGERVAAVRVGELDLMGQDEVLGLKDTIVNGSSVVPGKGPIQLTEHGEELAVTGSAEAWVEENAPLLEDQLDGKEEFEIYKMCVKHVAKLHAEDGDFQRTVERVSYQHSRTTEEVLTVFRVSLRDKLLSSMRTTAPE